MYVWKCGEEDDGLCGEVWAQEDTPDYCPACSFVLYHNARAMGRDPHVHIKRPIGVCTLEDARNAERRWEAFDIAIPVHVPSPIPLELVQLSTLPRSEWIGKGVFHPMGQMGECANWHRYEIGIVISVEDDPDFKDMVRCRFLSADFGNQGTLAYQPSNLWTAK